MTDFTLAPLFLVNRTPPLQFAYFPIFVIEKELFELKRVLYNLGVHNLLARYYPFSSLCVLRSNPLLETFVLREFSS